MARTWYFKPANGTLYTGWQSAASLGVESLSIHYQHLATDTATWTIPGDALANPLWSYDATIMIRYAEETNINSGVTWFVGRISSIPRQLTGTEEHIIYQATGGLAWLERITYEQQWATYDTTAGTTTTVAKPRVILGQDNSGNRITTGQQLAAVISHAITRGARLQLDPYIAAAGFTIPLDEQTNLKCADAVIALMRWMPDRKLIFDYNTTALNDWYPTLKLAGPTGYARTLALTSETSVELTPRYDLVIPGVRIIYEKTHDHDGDTYTTTQIDDAGNVSHPDAATISFDLAGHRATYAAQKVTTANYPTPTNDPTWWRQWAPWLADAGLSGILIHSVTRSEPSSALSRYLTDGALPDWLSVTRKDELWTAKVDYTRKDSEGKIIEVVTDKEISVRLTSTSASTRTYRRQMSFEAAETSPVGLAAALLSAWSILHYSGSITTTYDDFPLDASTWPQPWSYGQINLSGGRDEWAAMNANIQAATVDCATGAITYQLGPCAVLGAEDRVALYRAARGRQYAWSRGRRISISPSSDEVEGASGTPSLNTADGASAPYTRLVVRTDDHAIDLHPAGIAFKNSSHNTPQTLLPREVYLPVDDGEGGVALKLTQLLCSLPYGDAIPLDNCPVNPASVIAFGAGTSESAVYDTWLACSDPPKGLAIPVVTRIVYNPSGDKAIYRFHRILTFDSFGRLYSVSAETRTTVADTTSAS